MYVKFINLPFKVSTIGRGLEDLRRVEGVEIEKSRGGVG